MQRILFVLDMDLLAVDEHFDLAPINHLIARQGEEACEVTVLSLVDTRQTHLSGMELALGAQAGKFPVRPRPDHDISAAAEHRMNLARRHLKTIGCAATGLISDEPLLKAVRAETRRHDYDEVVLATGRQEGTLLARVLGQDPVHRLRHRWRKRLIVFSEPARHASLAAAGRRRYGRNLTHYLVTEFQALAADPRITGRHHGRDPLARLLAEAAPLRPGLSINQLDRGHGRDGRRAVFGYHRVRAAYASVADERMRHAHQHLDLLSALSAKRARRQVSRVSHSPTVPG